MPIKITPLPESFWEEVFIFTRTTMPATTFDERIYILKEVQHGWLQYYRMASIQEKLKDVDGWLWNRLRCCK